MISIMSDILATGRNCFVMGCENIMHVHMLRVYTTYASCVLTCRTYATHCMLQHLSFMLVLVLLLMTESAVVCVLDHR